MNQIGSLRASSLPRHRNADLLASPVCVFDIGGTWFRSALYAGNGVLEDVRRIPSLNFRDHPGRDVAELQSGLVDYLIRETRRLAAGSPGRAPARAAISMGAALNAHTGQVLNSGPLWGPDCVPFDLLAALKSAAPGIDWVVINDVTAALAFHAARPEFADDARLSLITVSTGIALRTFDRRLDNYPVDRLHGIQGEIGHLPTPFEFRGERIRLACDCGGQDHLNAFCSGRGLGALVTHLAVANPGAFAHLLRTTPNGLFDLDTALFARLVGEGDALALELLSAVTLPVAGAIAQLLTVDPEVEHVILTGGVVRSLGHAYRQQVVAHLDHLGMYPIATTDPGYFDRRVVLDDTAQDAGLIGAGLLAGARPESSALDEPSRLFARTLSATRTVAFQVQDAAPLLEPDSDALARFADEATGAIIVIDQAVDRIFGDRIRDYFARWGLAAHCLVLACAEQTKTPQEVERVNRWLDTVPVRRRTPVIAIGGGILLDIVGMAAGQYRRGIPYVRVPTTLLAMVDAAVGAKVGVNFNGHKSRVGLYYPPAAVLIDRGFLPSLPPRQLSNGMAEILKIALMLDLELVETLERLGPRLLKEGFQSAEGAEVIRRAVLLMMEQLEPNLWEANLDRLVDFGHSFSPALEMAAEGELLHGEAVAIDMILSCSIALGRRMIDHETWRRVASLVSSLGLPITHRLCDSQLLWRALQDTTLHRNGRQRLPLPIGLGQATFCNDVTLAEVENAWRRVCQLNAQHEHP